MASSGPPSRDLPPGDLPRDPSRDAAPRAPQPRDLPRGPSRDAPPHDPRTRDLAAEITRAWEREQPSLPLESIGILTRIRQAAKLLADERRRALAAAGMDAATLDLLSELRRSGPPYRLSTRELARRSLVTAGAVTQRVDRAQRAGFVRRLPAERGTRQVPVQLLGAGHQAITEAVGGLLGYEQEIVEVLPPADRAELARLLTVLLGHLAARSAPG
jgi:DNA-binding MarR family transcriptional regulator